MLENVEEFAQWGPLAGNGRPCLHRKGWTFQKWVRAIERAGYETDWRELRACDYGAPTIRNRLFFIARRRRSADRVAGSYSRPGPRPAVPHGG